MPLTLPLQARIQTLFDRVFDTLLFRKLYHFFFGFLILFGVMAIDRPVFFAIIFAYVAGFWFFGQRVSLAALGIVILFAATGSKFTTIGAGIIFVVGDGLAALIGSNYGRTKLPWHTHKTVVGSAAFLSSATIAMLIFLAVTLPGQPYALLLALLPSLAGCVAEGLPALHINGRPVTLGKSNLFDDNLVVILASGIAIHALIAWLGIRAAA